MKLNKLQRTITITQVRNTYATVSSTKKGEMSEFVEVEGGGYYITPNLGFENYDIYLFPYLFEASGAPWDDANLFLFSAIKNNDKGYTNSNEIQLKASRLLDYKIYCELNDIDLFNFMGRKPQRPTYRYYKHLAELVEKGELSRVALNKKTKVVYDFYKYLAKKTNSIIDLARVDTVKTAVMFITNSAGFPLKKNIEKRSQTIAVSSRPSPVAIGLVREYGEDLRPLTEGELDELLAVLNSDHFKVDERLMHLIALHTGARKQSILTMRMKHLKYFHLNNLLKDETFLLRAGPGTGIDTKFDNSQKLYFPKSIAEQIVIYSNSEKAQKRREKFKEKNGSILSDNDMYIFLSPEGEPHYMAKSDPRYKTTKSKPQGRNTYYLKKKLFKHVGEGFSRDFTFHWLRATYALHYYRFLQPLCTKGLVTDSDIISRVQVRLHHKDRQMTEKYLRLFDSISERLEAQKIFEERAINLYGDR